MSEARVSLSFSAAATPWYLSLTPERRKIVDEGLRNLARAPERSLGLVMEGVSARYSFIRIDDAEILAFKIEFFVDTLMQTRGGLPAIHIRTVKVIPAPGR